MNDYSGSTVKYIDGINRRVKLPVRQVTVDSSEDITLVKVRQNNTPKAARPKQQQLFYAQTATIAQPGVRLRRLSPENMRVISEAQSELLKQTDEKSALVKSAIIRISQQIKAVTSKLKNIHPLRRIKNFRESRHMYATAASWPLISSILIIALTISLATVSISYYNYRQRMNQAIAVQKKQYETDWQQVQAQWDCISKQWQATQSAASGTAKSVNGSQLCQQ